MASRGMSSVCSGMSDLESDGRVIHQLRDPPGQRSVYVLPGNTEEEIYRLSTFKDFPSNVPVDRRQFASHGFYYTGYKDRVKCFSCGQSSDNWMVGDDISLPRWHREDCQFINGTDTSNVPIVSLFHNNKIKNSICRSGGASQPIRNGASGSRADVHIPINSRSGADRFPAIHSNNTDRSIPGQSNAISINTGLQTQNDQESRQIIFRCLHPVNPHMRSTEARLQTFRDNASIWPAHRIRATPQEIADAGFFYLGERDRTKCWYCNGGLQNWERDDNPWEEHAKWFPMCEFLLREKGPEFVHGIVSRFPNLRRPTLSNLRTCISSNEVSRPQGSRQSSAHLSNGLQASVGQAVIVDPQEQLREMKRKIEEEIKSSELVAQARLMGFEDNVIKEALKRNYERDDRSCTSFENLVDTILMIPDEELAQIQNENVITNTENRIPSTTSTKQPPPAELQEMQRLEAERICKVCRKEASCIVMIPCGHLASCIECGNKVVKCPVCNTQIREKIRSYLS